MRSSLRGKMILAYLSICLVALLLMSVYIISTLRDYFYSKERVAMFTKANVVANMVLECRASVNILMADTQDIGGIATGQMILQLPEENQTADKMIAYLREKNLTVEELKDYVE